MNTKATYFLLGVGAVYVVTQFFPRTRSFFTGGNRFFGN